jgi:hypothetical protein
MGVAPIVTMEGAPADTSEGAPIDAREAERMRYTILGGLELIWNLVISFYPTIGSRTLRVNRAVLGPIFKRNSIIVRISYRSSYLTARCIKLGVLRGPHRTWWQARCRPALRQ